MVDRHEHREREKRLWTGLGYGKHQRYVLLRNTVDLGGYPGRSEMLGPDDVDSHLALKLAVFDEERAHLLLIALVHGVET